MRVTLLRNNLGGAPEVDLVLHARPSVAAALRAGASWSRAGMSWPGQLVELSQAVGTGALSRAELSQLA